MRATVRAESLAHAERIMRLIGTRAQLSTFGIATPCPDIIVASEIHTAATMEAVAALTSAAVIERAYAEALAIDAMRDSLAARRAGLRDRARCLETRAEGFAELAGLDASDVFFDATGSTVTLAPEVSK